MLSHAALLAVMLLTLGATCAAATTLPSGNAPQPLEFPHFPSRMHAFVWRNWTVVEAKRLALVLGTSEENVRAVAASMGLAAQPAIASEWKTRGYITVLRRNWHLLPYQQLLPLLEMTEEQLAYCLREDDFLFIKLGSLKPDCPPLHYAEPDEAARQRAAEIRRLVEAQFGERLLTEGERRFAFVERLGTPRHGNDPGVSGPQGRFGLRFIYSYFAMYGDPLLNPALDPYPDGLLQRLAAAGVDGVWLHVVLRTLAPGGETFPEFGADHEKRLETLRGLVQRAQRHGIRVYLYMNEPRALPAAFFEKDPARKGLRGVQEGGHYALCTSDPRVRQWLSDSLAYVFASVPGLGGVFTITASENFTNCASHQQHANCPQCKGRGAAEIIAEVNAAIEAGVHRGNKDARVIVWDWGWNDAWTPEVIGKLPKSCWLMSVSEWSKPLTRGGVKTEVGEYSLSAVGPGPRATKHWALAKQAGLKTVAKVQLNNTWELSAVPYLPVLDLVAEHCHNLASAGVDGMMLSWSLGGYPSPNLELAQQFNAAALPANDEALATLARSWFGPQGAGTGRKAWSAFSAAFAEFPFHVSVVYQAPTQYAPANLLCARESGYTATMVGFPYDDLTRWRGPYPPQVFAEQFAKVAAGWQEGLAHLEQAVRSAPPERAEDAKAQLLFAQVAGLHFQSVANQARFVIARGQLLAKDQPPTAEARRALLEQMRALAADEREVARRTFALARQDSRVAYEASNHYYYVPLDLAEKVINCQWLIEHALADH